MKPTPADERRIALGLPRTALSGRLGPGEPLPLWLTSASLEAFDGAAAGTGITRRRYVTALLEAHLGGADTRLRRTAAHSTTNA